MKRNNRDQLVLTSYQKAFEKWSVRLKIYSSSQRRLLRRKGRLTPQEKSPTTKGMAPSGRPFRMSVGKYKEQVVK